LDDDEPRAVQAMLRYLYTEDCKTVFRSDDPLFSDVERDLDVFVIADKYDLRPLKRYMHANLVRFYETDQRPAHDPKGWSAKNQKGFANVLRKLYQLEVDATDLRRAMVSFAVRSGQKVLSWPGVQDAIDGDVQLSNDLIKALFAAKRVTDSRMNVLDMEKEDLQEQIESLTEEKDDWKGEAKNLAGLVAGYNHEMVSPIGSDDYPYWD
jgi:hypothetical protein